MELEKLNQGNILNARIQDLKRMRETLEKSGAPKSIELKYSATANLHFGKDGNADPFLDKAFDARMEDFTQGFCRDLEKEEARLTEEFNRL